MLNKIILASKSEVRKEILVKNNIKCIVEPSNVDEEPVKEGLLKEQASSEITVSYTHLTLPTTPYV